MTGSIDLGRRQFAGQLAAGTSALVALAACGPSFVQSDEPSVPPAEAAKPGVVAEPPVKPTLEAMLLAYLVQRYPSNQYDENALRGIYTDLRSDVARGRTLSEFPLKNSDEPAFVFRVYRAPD